MLIEVNKQTDFSSVFPRILINVNRSVLPYVLFQDLDLRFVYLEKIENYLNHFDKEGATTESLNDIKRFLLSNKAQKKITDMFK